jgi:hypothetical protein
VGSEITRTRREVRQEAKRRGYTAVGAAVVTGAASVLWLPFGVVGLGATGWLTWRWLKYRAKNGLRF